MVPKQQFAITLFPPFTERGQHPKSISKKVYFHAMLINLLISAARSRIIEITWQCFCHTFLVLVKVCALHFKQFRACLAKRLISKAVYHRIAHIKREKRHENGMRYSQCNHYSQKQLARSNDTQASKRTHKQRYCNYPGSFQSFHLLCKVCRAAACGEASLPLIGFSYRQLTK